MKLNLTILVQNKQLIEKFEKINPICRNFFLKKIFLILYRYITEIKL